MTTGEIIVVIAASIFCIFAWVIVILKGEKIGNWLNNINLGLSEETEYALNIIIPLLILFAGVLLGVLCFLY